MPCRVTLQKYQVGHWMKEAAGLDGPTGFFFLPYSLTVPSSNYLHKYQPELFSHDVNSITIFSSGDCLFIFLGYSYPAFHF